MATQNQPAMDMSNAFGDLTKMLERFKLPGEYVQGFCKAGQSLLHALTPIAGSSGSAGASTSPARAAPLAELQLNYFQQPLALWARMMSAPGGSEPVVAPEHR